MASGPYKYKFNRQAAFGTAPGVMAEIHKDGCNIGVWKGAAAAIRESEYVQNLDLSSLGKGMRWEHGYFREVIAFDLHRPTSQTSINRRLLNLNRYLEYRGFPNGDKKSDYPRRQFAAQLINLDLHFSAAMNNSPVGFSLLVFRPRGRSYWHTDYEKARGICTIKGDDGTLWRPDSTLPKSRRRDSGYWGSFASFNPLNGERLDLEDVAAFRCDEMGQALVHATPRSQDLRLVMTMGLLSNA